MEKKIEQVNTLIELLGVTREDVINSWLKSSPNHELVSKMENLMQYEKDRPNIFALSDIVKIEPGMIWYEDDTFSFSIIEGKRIKAVVEYVSTRDNEIYGDLTASTIYDIQERLLSYDDAIHRRYRLSSICKGNEELVDYDQWVLRSVALNYAKIEETLRKISRRPRSFYQWAGHQKVSFGVTYSERVKDAELGEENYYRPVLRAYVNRISF